MYDPSFSSIVDGLSLGDINNMAAHASSRYEGSFSIVLQLLPIDRCTFLLLTSPMKSRDSCTVESSIHIGSHDLSIMLELSSQNRTLSPRNAGISDEYIKPAIKFFDDVVHGSLNRSVGGDVDLVCFACG
jgi:hypothetical protein